MRKPKPPPPLSAIDRRQSMAVNHVAKFVADELIIEPKGFLRLSALGRVYHDWCEVHGVMNRRVSASELLLGLERDHGLTCGTVYVNVQEGTPGALHALRGARLRLPELNARRKYSADPGRGGGGASPARWAPVIEGVVPDVAQGFADADDDAIEEDE